MKSPVSIRASLQQRGEPIQQRAPIFSTSFNPRLTSAARRTNELIHNLSCVAFQSAPHFSSEANPVVKRGRPRKVVFQSAPHFSSEANIAVFHAVGVRYSFQSAPHFSSEANDRYVISSSPIPGFNPRLTSAARRTSIDRAGTVGKASFNPRLTSAARRTPSICDLNCLFPKFQSAPHFSSEANAFDRR